MLFINLFDVYSSTHNHFALSTSYGIGYLPNLHRFILLYFHNSWRFFLSCMIILIHLSVCLNLLDVCYSQIPGPVIVCFLLAKRCHGISHNTWKWIKETEKGEITHRDAGYSASPSAVTVYSLWCKDILELLGPAAAVYHAASPPSLVMYITVAITTTVLPPVACCGLSHE